jgi:hypothetical protein
MKTGTTELIRNKKFAKSGKARKKRLAKRGTINFYTHFETPAADDEITKAKQKKPA